MVQAIRGDSMAGENSWQAVQPLHVTSIVIIVVGFILKWYFPLSSVLPHKHDFAVRWNATIGFFPESDKASCKAHNVANAITFSTGDAPGGPVCFNLPDLFGRQLNFTVPKFVGQTRPDQIVNYTLSNAASYNPNTNYTRVWYDLNTVNPRGPNAEGGGWSPWTLTTYTIRDCSDYGSEFQGGLGRYADTSCRTKDGGDCEEVPLGVRSFRIFSNSLAQQQGGGDTPKCETWKVWASAASILNRQTSMLAAIAVFVAAFFVM
ncbi:hypothetical protein VTL71DRAFT_13143 [Oculimacula yallundae]|uniref:Uncharacterized protein n=1 Tax=Oculimacula yallundae TaxID=86028 RepID=A0ABR4CQ89_9HELO